MGLAGTVVNGSIVLDGGLLLPEGERVRVELERDLDEDDFGPPPEPYDHEKHLALLREAHEEANAGRTRPFEEVMAEIRRDYNLPPIDAE